MLARADRDGGKSGTSERAGDGRVDDSEQERNDIAVELCVRSLSPQGASSRQEAVIDHLADLEERGVIETFSLIVWGARFAPGSAAARTATGRELERRIEAFERWVAQAEKPDELAFEHREVRSLVSDERREEIVLPVLCLVVYQDEVLRCVSPWSATEMCHSIDDCLEAIVRPGHIDGHPSVTLDDGHPIHTSDDRA